ncbi:MAG: ATP--guanido phosphotransferase [Candidatus Stahlbacteria bacterium]|nr:ATP--guanido phosphotransferase [Candidatus Stahlbacteria bacterium]
MKVENPAERCTSSGGEDFFNITPLWSSGEGIYSEIVLSSRIRLARNLAAFKFPILSSVKEIEEVFAFISERISFVPIFSLAHFSAFEHKLLLERHLVSNELLKEIAGRGVGIFSGESISFMLNEEDHLRMQSIVSGLELALAYKKLNELDDTFSTSLGFAFSPKFGYLTSCPTNVGTGMRASVLLHLPALVHSSKIRKIVDNLASIGFIVRGFHSESAHIEGNFFHLSTQPTIGRKEEDLISGLHKIVMQLIEYENSARELLLKNAHLQVEDKIWRAMSILKSARLLSVDEFVNLSSAVRLGVGLGILKDVKISTLNQLLIFVQPAHLGKLLGEPKELAEYDMRRAMYVRELLNKGG